MRAINNIEIGATKNIDLFVKVGENSSLVRSLIASPAGVGSPINDGLLGPFRS